jgi:hypothetical protein
MSGRKCWSYPSPSNLISVSASNLRHRPTEVVWVDRQSTPSKMHSSWQETTARYRVLPSCADSNFTAWKPNTKQEKNITYVNITCQKKWTKIRMWTKSWEIE